MSSRGLVECLVLEVLGEDERLLGFDQRAKWPGLNFRVCNLIGSPKVHLRSTSTSTWTHSRATSDNQIMDHFRKSQRFHPSSDVFICVLLVPRMFTCPLAKSRIQRQNLRIENAYSIYLEECRLKKD